MNVEGRTWRNNLTSVDDWGRWKLFSNSFHWRHSVAVVDGIVVGGGGVAVDEAAAAAAVVVAIAQHGWIQQQARRMTLQFILTKENDTN
ncbi:hypothetical protein BHM03_00028050 [Ensete ventricosum]|nr:hypothetical protein BHM03_00028050 [Ensete ventricosum]